MEIAIIILFCLNTMLTGLFEHISVDHWQIEIFFKTIKQNLKIKSFFGTSRNAVLTQIWISMIAFLLLKYLVVETTTGWTVTGLMAVIPILLFLKKDLWIGLINPRLRPFSMDDKLCQLEFGLW